MNENEFPEWLVELRPVDYPEFSEVVIVRAPTDLAATRLAFQTRNISCSWEVADVQRA